MMYGSGDDHQGGSGGTSSSDDCASDVPLTATLRLRGGGPESEDADDATSDSELQVDSPPLSFGVVADSSTPVGSPCGSDMMQSPGGSSMEVSPPRPSVRLRLQYPACPEPCPEEPMREQLEEVLRENRELHEKLDQSRAIASKLRARVKAMEAHLKGLHTSVNEKVRVAKNHIKERQYELVRTSWLTCCGVGVLT